MNRRGFVRALAAVPAAPALLGQQPGPAQPAPGIPLNPTTPIQPPASAANEIPKLDPSVADEAAEMMPRYFSPAQMAALRKLCDMMMPAMNGRPGALDAKAPEFLDFLIGDSPADRKELYREGLDSLNGTAKKRFGKAFAEVDAKQADELLAPLRQQWTYDTPADPLARFLRAAKVDVRTATANSREYAAGAGGNAGARRAGGGLYWYPLD